MVAVLSFSVTWASNTSAREAPATGATANDAAVPAPVVAVLEPTTLMAARHCPTMANKHHPTTHRNARIHRPVRLATGPGIGSINDPMPQLGLLRLAMRPSPLHPSGVTSKRPHPVARRGARQGNFSVNGKCSIVRTDSSLFVGRVEGVAAAAGRDIGSPISIHTYYTINSKLSNKHAG
jgi:hypothetical protein